MQFLEPHDFPQPLEAKSLFKLTFHKNADGKFHCPVTYKVFNENTHIVAVKTTGNVYCMEAVERLNLKPRNMRDLITDQPFTKADLVTLQDPTDLGKFNMSSFHHLKNSLTVGEEEEERARKNPTYYLKMLNPETRATLEQLYQQDEFKGKKVKVSKGKQKATARTAAHYSTGAVAHSFTSTATAPVTENEAAIIDRDSLRYAKVKKKGYVRLHTSLGDLNLELHCEMLPLACENFLRHCGDGYYDNCIFHRSIRNFMIQGGDPTGTGTGGRSIWGKPFKDEFRPNLSHSGRGVVSMANSGKNTNSSQFFVTYRSCKHLDNKHTVFGRVVGGMEVLGGMEAVETNEEDRPREEIKILRTEVFMDPFKEAEEELVAEEEKEKAAVGEEQPSTSGLKREDAKPKAYHDGVGRYIPKTSVGRGKRKQQSADPPPQLSKKTKIRSTLGDFSGW
jgi:peptidyl-prolyl cis-trans isomerase-like protein 2